MKVIVLFLSNFSIKLIFLDVKFKAEFTESPSLSVMARVRPPMMELDDNIPAINENRYYFTNQTCALNTESMKQSEISTISEITHKLNSYEYVASMKDITNTMYQVLFYCWNNVKEQNY